MPQIKKFNWVRRPSTWEYAQAWKSQRKQMAQRFLDDGAAISSAFANAQNNLSMGMATLAAQASLTNTQNQLTAAKSSATSLGSSVDTTA